MLHPEDRNVIVEIEAGALDDLYALSGGYTFSWGKFIDKDEARRKALEALDHLIKD